MKKRIVFSILMLLLLSLLCACGKSGMDSSEKEVVTSYGLYPAYTFEEACDEASTIVIGTVVAVAEPTLYPVLPNKDIYDVSTAFTLSVETTIKGDRQDTLIFKQEGGETEDKIYKVEGIELPKKGDRLLLFLNDRGLIITPDYGMTVDSDGNITTSYFPEDYNSSKITGAVTISVDDYAALIEGYLEK